MPAYVAGDRVQTPFGKGTVREIRNNDRVLVDVAGRAMELHASDVVAAAEPRSGGRRVRRQAGDKEPAGPPPGLHPPPEVDLHGLTVAEALDRAERALNDALLADAAELRFIHGRSGGRIKAALHQWLKATPSVRKFRLDPRNEGVTTVLL